MTAKVLKWSSIIVVLLSVLFPVGAYFGAVALYILAIKARKTRLILAELSMDTPVLIILFSVLLSVTYSRDILLSLAGSFIAFLNLGLYLVLIVELKDIRLKSYCFILDLACVSACIFGIYQLASGDINMQKSWVDEETFGTLTRIYSTLLNPNIFAAYLAMYLPFGLARFKDLREEPLLTAGIGLASVCLLLTHSRGGFAAFGAAMLVLYIIKGRKKGIVLYAAAMTAAYAAINSTAYFNRAGLAAIYRDSSSFYRLEIWKAALSMFLEDPVFGHGIGTVWYYLSSGSDKLYRYILHSHNIYLHVAAEMGITGLCAFVYLIVRKLWEGLKLIDVKASGEEAYIIQGFIACIAGIAVHGLVDAVIFVPAFSLIFMSYYALYGRVIAEHCAELPARIPLPSLGRLRIVRLLDGKGALKLFWGKSARKNKYHKEESKAYQA